MDDYELARELEEARKSVRCVNCYYYLKQPGTAPLRAICRRNGEIQRYDDHCLEWSTFDWDDYSAQNNEAKESTMNYKDTILDSIVEELHNPPTVTAKKEWSSVRIEHQAKRFPGFKITHHSPSDNFLVTTTGAHKIQIALIKDFDDAETFCQIHRLLLKIRPGRKAN
jgi:hypothetical protein